MDCEHHWHPFREIAKTHACGKSTYRRWNECCNCKAVKDLFDVEPPQPAPQTINPGRMVKW